MKKLHFLFLSLFIVFSACKKKKTDEPVVCDPSDQMEVHLIPKLDGQNYALNQIIVSPQGYRYFFTEIKILGTDVANGSNVLSDSYYYDFYTSGTLMRTGSGLKSDFANLSLNIGVPTTLNHANPALPASTSALNISNCGDMHWGWNPGYIFVKLEGKVDTLDNGIDNFDHNFVFHLGMDPIFRTLNFSGMNWISLGENKYRTNLLLQVKDIFDKPGEELDLRVDYSSHSTNTQMFLSNSVVDKLVNAVEKE
jgi:hypothetical protein|tara:strand:- start:4730 stop:5485 length:756 start_codon:yes stop_codon:yes gene_type:complete